jgi:hypothetical protein
MTDKYRADFGMKCSEETEILEEALFQSTLFATNPT